MPSVTLLACHPAFAAGSIMICPDPELFGLTEVTSKAALLPACANTGCTWSAPTNSGTARAADATVTSRHFFRMDIARWPVFVMMCSILFLSSDPVTPATHVNGASA